MGDGVDTNIGDLGTHREWCPNVKNGLENHWYEDRNMVHQKSNMLGDKQNKRDSYNSYLKKVVK